MNTKTIARIALTSAAALAGFGIASINAPAQSVYDRVRAMQQANDEVLDRANYYMERELRLQEAECGIDSRKTAGMSVNQRVALIQACKAQRQSGNSSGASSGQMTCSQARHLADNYRSIAESAARACQTGTSAASTGSCMTASQAAQQAAYYESVANRCR